MLSASALTARSDIQAQIERLWVELGHDPAQRAEACARLCLEQAPQLADWLKGKILAAIPDRELAAALRPPVTDARILAYNRLCALAAPAVPLQTAAPAVRPAPAAPPGKRTAKPQSAFQAMYEGIFGVTPEILPDMPAELRVEPEIGRICIGLHKASEYRLYVIARELTRSADGSGKVAKSALRDALRRYGIPYTPRHLNRLLEAGKGLFWNLSRKHVYVRAYGWLASRLAELAPALFLTNLPGVRDVYLSPTGTHEQWEAMLYAAWCAHRENPTIARATLEQLFNRSQDTLRRWEQTRLEGILAIRANDVQCPHPLTEDDRYAGYIPEHSQAYLANVHFQGQWQQVIRLRWRTSNTYQICGIRQHPKRGQARKVRHAVNQTLEQPADEKRGGPHPLRRYFDDVKHLKAYTEKHGSMGYLWRGENRAGQGIFEINRTGFPFTHANERAPAQQERRYLWKAGG